MFKWCYKKKTKIRMLKADWTLKIQYVINKKTISRMLKICWFMKIKYVNIMKIHAKNGLIF